MELVDARDLKSLGLHGLYGFKSRLSYKINGEPVSHKGRCLLEIIIKFYEDKKKEILDYIDSQPWKDKFYKNAFESEGDTKSFDDLLIDNAFYRGETKEGAGFWKEIA